MNTQQGRTKEEIEIEQAGIKFVTEVLRWPIECEGSQMLQAYIEGAKQEISKAKGLRDALKDLIESYDKWEANIISDSRHWGPEGMNSYPTLIESTYEEMLALQNKRNKAREWLDESSPIQEPEKKE